MSTQQNKPLIRVVDLNHSYKDHAVLKHINFTIAEGEIFGFLGHNGAGKTTTINILTTLLQPTSGKVEIFGHNVIDHTFQVRRHIGYVPETVQLYDNMNARENLEFFAKLSGVKNVSKAVSETFTFLDCEDLADKRLGTFSKGMRQRIGLAQAIVHKPKILFLDEPTSGLDPEGVQMLRSIILRLNKELGMTIFMNTHLLSEVTKTCTSIGILKDGELIYQDSLGSTLKSFPDQASLEDIYLKIEAKAGW